jgi:hypothetical protein
VLLAGLPDLGIARSDDGGQTWAPSNAGLTASLLVGLAFSPSFATDQTIVAASLQSGVSVTHDAGRTWTECSVGLDDQTVVQVAVSPAFAEDRTLYAATGSGLYVSRDAAERWQPALPDEPPVPAIAVAIAHSPHPDPLPEGEGVFVLAALADGTLLASEDGGITWKRLDTPFGEAEVVAQALSSAFATNGTMFVATAGPLHQGERREIVVWASTDRGQHWERRLEEHGAPPVQLLALPPNPFGDTVVVGLGGRLLRPLGRAQEVRRGTRRPLWSEVALPGPPAALTGLAASPDYHQDRTLFAATSTGVDVSRDGGERFTAWNDGLELPAVVAVAPSPAYAQDRLVYALGLGGTIWRRVVE